MRVRRRRVLQAVLRTILPWPSRTVRRARVHEAQRGAAHEQRRTVAAWKLENEIREIVRENHFAYSIAEGLWRAHRPQEGSAAE